MAPVVAGRGARTRGGRERFARRVLQYPASSPVDSRDTVADLGPGLPVEADGAFRVEADGVLLLDPEDDIGADPDESLSAAIFALSAPDSDGPGYNGGDASVVQAVPVVEAEPVADNGLVVEAEKGVVEAEKGAAPQPRDTASSGPLDRTRTITSGRPRHLARGLLRYWWAVPLTLVVAVTTFLAGLFLAPLDVTPPPAAKPALLLDLLGRPVAAVRAPATPQEIPGEAITDRVRAAVVAAVDPGFQSRAGVDPFTLVGAAWHDIAGGGGGNTTITQRYVASVLLDDDESLPQTRAAALGLRLEQRLSRQEILTRYLNTAYFGNGAYGIQAAALAYFGVPAPALTLAQAAMLGGILVDPERVNPYVDRSAARARQLATLAKMAALHMISTREAADAGMAPLGLRPAGQPAGVAPDFSDRTATELRAAYGERAIYSSDLRVRTSIDLDLQTAVNATLAGLPAGSGPVAVAAVDPRDGGVRALGHVGRKLGTTPADGLTEPFLSAAQLGGGDAVSLAELAGLDATGTDALSAAQAYGTLVASGRRAQLRDVLAVTLPSGPSGRPLPVPQTESSAQVLPGPKADQVRDLLMWSPLPSGAQAAAQQFPLLAGVSPAMFVGCTLSLCLAVQTGSGPTAASAQPGQAPAIFAQLWAGYLGRAGERAVPPTMSPPAPVTASPSPYQGSGGPEGSQSAVTPDHVPPGSSTNIPSRDYTPPAPIPSAPPVIVRGPPPVATPTPTPTPTPAPPTAQQTNSPSQAPQPSPSPTAAPPTPSASPPVAESSPAGSPAFSAPASGQAVLR